MITIVYFVLIGFQSLSLCNKYKGCARIYKFYALKNEILALRKSKCNIRIFEIPRLDQDAKYE